MDRDVATVDVEGRRIFIRPDGTEAPSSVTYPESPMYFRHEGGAWRYCAKIGTWTREQGR
ncbi:hypothetical protein [Williamsia sterculiae]|uniref:hypothetical protein n=1 Tax=Williamsia sterculiae TaxID=1344003 RepID=UPI00117EE7A0|nr:hypothetical protein [Williamsia sterculiae]